MAHGGVDRDSKHAEAQSLLRLLEPHDAELRDAIPGYLSAGIEPLFRRITRHSGWGVVIHVSGSYRLREVAEQVRTVLHTDVTVRVKKDRPPLTL